jgi:polyhydroxyalkanoate synthesis regulator phasin
MNKNAKMKFLGAGLAAIAVAGGGVAISATKPWSPNEESQAVISDAAKQLGVKPSELSDALRKAVENRIDEAVAAGRLTKEQGDALKARLESADVPFPFPGFGFRFGDFAYLGPFGKLDAAASYLGLSQSELQSRLADGKTLAQIAKDQGKSVEGLVNALVKATSDRIDAAVDAGKLTKSQADELKPGLKERIADLVNGALRFGRGFGVHGPRPGFPGFRHSDRMPGFPGFERGQRLGPSA